MFKKLSVFFISVFLLSGCAGLEMAEQTKAQFSTYHDAAYVSAEDDVLLLSDTSSVDAVKGIYLKDLPSAREGIVVAASNAHDRIKKQADYICDGTADQVEINAAILEAVGTPYADISVPVFLNGDFSINAPIRIRPGLTLDGGNLRQGAYITLASGSNCNMMYFDETNQYASFITLKNFCINGDSDNQTSGNGIEFITNPMDVYMSDLWVTNCKETGIKQPFGWGNFYTNIIVEYCLGWGIEIKENAIITASKVIDNDGGGIKITGSSNQIIGGLIGAGTDNTQAILIDSTASNNIINGINTAIGAGTNRDGIVIAGDQNVISNCISISTNARYQIWLQSTATYNFVSGNVARTAITDNIKVDERANFIHDNQQSVTPLWITDDYTIEDTRESFSFVVKSPSSPAATKDITLSTKIRINTKMEIFNYSGATTLMIDPTGLNHAVAPGEAAIFLKDSDSNWVLISSAPAANPSITPVLFVANDTTPDISGSGRSYITQNTSTTVYTTFDWGGGSAVDGEEFLMIVNDEFTGFNFETGSLEGVSENYTAQNGELVRWKYSTVDLKWHYLGFPKTAKMTLVLSAASRAVVTNADSEIVVSDVTATEINLLDGLPVLPNLTSTDKGNSGTTTQTLDYDVGISKKITATDDFTLAFSNWPSSGIEGRITLYAVNFGDHIVTYPASIDWDGGTEPQETSAGIDVMVFTTIDGGTTVYGFVAGKDLR